MLLLEIPTFILFELYSRTRSGSDPSISLDGTLSKKKLDQHRKASQENASSSPKSGKIVLAISKIRYSEVTI